MKRKFVWTFLIITILLHLAFVLPTAMTKMYRTDDMVFIQCAKSILNDGIPIYANGQTVPKDSCLYHPPLYSYLLSFSVFVFGENPLPMRSISIIFNVLTIIMVYFISLILLKENKNKHIYAIITAALYALNPLAIQSSIILDIDGGILNFAMSLFVYLYLKGKKGFSLGISLFLIFWTKLPGVIVLFSSFLIFFLLHKNWKKIIRLVALFLFTGIIFCVCFFIYTNYSGQDFLMLFKYASIFRVLIEAANNPIILIAKALWALKTFIYFITPFFALLFLYSTIKTVTEKKKTKKIHLFWIIPLVATVIFMISGATGWGFPKYYIVAVPYMSILIGYMISEKFSDVRFLNKKFLLLIILTSLLVILNIFLLIRDPLLPEVIGTAKTTSFIEAAEKISLTFGLYAIIPLVLALGIFYAFPKGKRIAGTLFYLTFLMFFYINIIQVTADYSTNYLYGDSETGLKETINFLKMNNVSSENFASYSHVGYYFEKENMEKFIEVTRIINSEAEFKKWAIENEKLIYTIIYEKDIKKIGGGLDYFKLDRKIGTYYIYKKRDSKE